MRFAPHAGFNTFWGLARPPTSYGAYAGDNKDAAKCVSTLFVCCTVAWALPPARLGITTRRCCMLTASLGVQVCIRLPSKLEGGDHREGGCTCNATGLPGVWHHHHLNTDPAMDACAVQNEKGMQGIDSRVRNTRVKGEHVISLAIMYSLAGQTYIAGVWCADS